MPRFTELEPPLEHPSSLSCRSVRLVIKKSANHFRGSEFMLDVEDEGYLDQEISLGIDLNEAREAFEKRPVDCMMTVDCDDKYDCSKCKFIGDLSLAAQGIASFE